MSRQGMIRLQGITQCSARDERRMTNDEMGRDARCLDKSGTIAWMVRREPLVAAFVVARDARHQLLLLDRACIINFCQKVSGCCTT